MRSVPTRVDGQDRGKKRFKAGTRALEELTRLLGPLLLCCLSGNVRDLAEIGQQTNEARLEYSAKSFMHGSKFHIDESFVEAGNATTAKQVAEAIPLFFLRCG
jgi:hypothetical protein